MHDIILESTTEIFKDHCTKELIDRLEEGQWASELWDVLVQSGITLIGVPEETGGSGGDYVDAFHIMRLAGKYAAPLPLTETIIVNWLIASYEKEVLGDTVYSYNITSKNEINLEKSDEGYLVNGVAKGVAWANHADQLLTLTNLDGDDVLVLLPLDKAIIDKNQNLAGEPVDNITFESVIVKDVWIQPVSKEEILRKITYLTALSKSAMMSGAMERVLELSIQYTTEREQFGRPLHRFQAIQQQLALLSGEIISILTIVNEAISLFNKTPDKSTYEIAATKLRANEATEIVTELAHQIHGAIGVTHEHSLHQFTRRLWSWREEGGNEKYWTRQMTEQFLKLDDSVWSMITGSDFKTV